MCVYMYIDICAYLYNYTSTFKYTQKKYMYIHEISIFQF